MQKWDYLYIVVDYEGNNYLGRPRYLNGQELPNWEQGETILSVINKLGWKGRGGLILDCFAGIGKEALFRVLPLVSEAIKRLITIVGQISEFKLK